LRLIVKTQEGLEPILALELEDLGAEQIEIVKRAVLCTGDLLLLYKAHLQVRTALKFLVFMQEFAVRDEEDLYTAIKKVKWEEYIGTDNTLAIDSVVNSEKFRHSNYVALKCKDAIVDRFREKTGNRPSIDVQNPDLRINIHIRQHTATLSLDSSGRSLHMRGYRRQQVEAPLNEVLAAGILMMSGWNAMTPLLDPMCGSGTILCEAANMALRRPPCGYDHEFLFKKWKSFNPDVWEIAVEETKAQELTTCPPIMGTDSNPKAVSASLENIEVAGLTEYIQVVEDDFFYHEGLTDSTLVFNPPYDGRLKEKDVIQFYQHIGDKLKMGFAGCSAWILSGHIEAMKNVGLRPSAKKQLLNGSIPSLLCRFDMYSGSKKAKYNQPEP
jgi:putative N6-adenine-specific DNA methylase